MAFNEHAAIDRFWSAHRAGEHFPAEWRDRLDFDQAYRIQLGVAARRIDAGERQAGWKIAQTSEAGRRSFGFAEPLFGCLMRDGLRRSGHVYARDALIRPGCEPELVLRMGRSLSGTVDPGTARLAVDQVCPALEIIEVRGDIPGQKALAIADNSATKDAVLGDPAPLHDDLDLAAVTCRVFLNDREVAAGRAAEVMGDPLNALVWLSAKLAQFGRGLEAGDLVLTGSMTRMLPLSPGDRARAVFAGLGALEAAIAA